MSGETQASDDAGESKGGKVRTRKVKSAPAVVEKRSLNLRLDIDVYERLNVHALMEHVTVSDLVSRLTREHCRSYSVHRVGKVGDAAAG